MLYCEQRQHDLGESVNEITAPEAPTTTEPKQPWHPPTIEEVDYTATEAGAGFSAIYDGPYTYTY